MPKLLAGWFLPAPRPALVGFFLFLSAGFAEGVMVPFFPLWAEGDAGIAVGYIGLLYACYAGGELLATPFLGGIADRVGRRPVLIVSAAGIGLGFLALPFAHGAPAAAMILVATGVFECVLHPTVLTVIADTTPPEAHRRHFGQARVCANAGRVLGPAAGALLALISIRWVVVAGGAMLLMAAFVTLAALPETLDRSRPDGDEDDEEEHLSSLLPAFTDPRLAALLLWFLLLETTGSWIEAVLPLHARDGGLLTPSGVGALFTYAALLVVVGQMAVGRMTEHRSSLSLALWSGGCLALGFGALLVPAGVGGLVAAVSLYAVSDMLTGPLVPASVNALAPQGRRATYMAATSVASDLKDSLGPATGTALYAVGGSLPWLVAIPLAAGASLGLGRALLRADAATRRTDGNEGRPRRGSETTGQSSAS